MEGVMGYDYDQWIIEKDGIQQLNYDLVPKKRTVGFSSFTYVEESQRMIYKDHRFVYQICDDNKAWHDAWSITYYVLIDAFFNDDRDFFFNLARVDNCIPACVNPAGTVFNGDGTEAISGALKKKVWD